MTTLNNQFNELMKVTLEEKQALTDDKNDIQQEVISLIIQSESTLQVE